MDLSYFIEPFHAGIPRIPLPVPENHHDEKKKNVTASFFFRNFSKNITPDVVNFKQWQEIYLVGLFCGRDAKKRHKEALTIHTVVCYKKFHNKSEIKHRNGILLDQKFTPLRTFNLCITVRHAMPRKARKSIDLPCY